MDDKSELTISIGKAESLKKMQKMSGWKIIEDFLTKSDDKYNKQLRDDTNDDIADVKACRKVLEVIKDFRDLLRFTELSAEEDQRELDIIKGEKGE
ncbi:MAG: hypothetical protein H8D54_00895 [Candidatus Omnitrophica bacterium]|nr:hypothetical protein [Candidatus Omnitrophota bacterium]